MLVGRSRAAGSRGRISRSDRLVALERHQCARAVSRALTRDEPLPGDDHEDLDETLRSDVEPEVADYLALTASYAASTLAVVALVAVWVAA